MVSKRSRILGLIEKGRIAPEDAGRAMKIAGVFPDTKAWLRFAERMLLGLGTLAVGAGVIFFVAYNWEALGRVGKIALIEGVLAVSLLPLLRFGTHSRIGRFSLLGASILVGALLALFGQIYQTGADSWEMFAAWAVLIGPWVWLGRFAPLWILWITVVNAALALRFSLYSFPFTGLFDKTASAFVLLVFNTLVTVIWESTVRSRSRSDRIALHIPATFAAIAATVLGIRAVMDSHTHYLLWLALWAVWLGGNCLVYRYAVRDLFMLGAGCLSVIVVFAFFLGKIFLIEFFTEYLGLLIVAAGLVGGGTAAAAWLRHIAGTWESSDDRSAA